MLRDAFLKGLRDQLRPFAMWAAGVAFYVALLISIYPSIRKSAGAIQEYVKNMPEAIRAAFMGSSDFSTPVGYVNVELLSWLAPIVLIGFAVVVAARSVAGEEESGTLGPRAHARRGTHAVRAAEVRRDGRRRGRAGRRVLALAQRRHGHRRHAGRDRRPRRGVRQAHAARPRRGQRLVRGGRGDRAPAGRGGGRRRRRRADVPAQHARGDERDRAALALRLALLLGGRSLAPRQAAGLGRRAGAGRQPPSCCSAATLVLFERRDLHV